MVPLPSSAPVCAQEESDGERVRARQSILILFMIIPYCHSTGLMRKAPMFVSKIAKLVLYLTITAVS